jgi:hypothetical protein
LAPLLLLLACVSQKASDIRVKWFDPGDYPAGVFRVSNREYAHGSVTVRIIEAKRIQESAIPPSYCSAWLEVRQGDRVLRQIHYDDIEPVGFSYGIFVPKRQQFADYFGAVKEGDYDGRLLLIGKDGTLSDLPGGFYFVTADKRHLIGLHAMDSDSLVVIDSALRQVVFNGEKEGVPEVHSWYLDDAGYFFTEVDQRDGSQPPREVKGSAYRLDLERHIVLKVTMLAAHLAASRRISYDFDPQNMMDCSSDAQ